MGGGGFMKVSKDYWFVLTGKNLSSSVIMNLWGRIIELE